MISSTTVRKKEKNVSIIDLGYNSIKISTYSVFKNGPYKKIDQQQEYVQIGSNLSNNNNLIPEQNVERTILALNKFKKMLKELDVDIIIPVATSAVRDADNTDEVVKSITKNTKIEFNVLTGSEEGFFSYLGSQSIVHIPNGIFFDLGGGSLELIEVQNYKITNIFGMDLGVLRLADKFTNYIKNDKELDYLELEKFLKQNIPGIYEFDFIKSASWELVGIGGTIRSIYKFIANIFKNPNPFSYHHTVLEKKMIDLSNSFFVKLSPQQLSNLKAMDSSRSKTICIGSFIVKILMEKLKINDVLISPSGLREGILENYLYFEMDKKYRQKKQFIEINYDLSPKIQISDGNSDNVLLDKSHDHHYLKFIPKRIKPMKVSEILK